MLISSAQRDSGGAKYAVSTKYIGGCAMSLNLEYLGITIDEVKNREQAEAVKISDGTSRVNVLVIKTNEELEIAREAAAVAEGLV